MVSERRRRLALVGRSALLSLLGLEIVLRFIEPREVFRESFVTPDPVLHHKFIAGARGRQKTTEFDTAYSINSFGLRELELPRDKPAGVKRILMLGDSFTEGIGVDSEETFSSRLQHLLNDDGLAERWEVINAGVGSYSPMLEYLYLKKGGLALQPDLVVLDFDLSDVNDDIQYSRLAEFDANGDLVAVHAEPPPEKRRWPIELLVDARNLLKHHTRTYGFLWRRVAGYVEAARHKGNFSGDVRFDKYAMLRERASASGDREWTLSYRYLLKIRDLLKARGVDFWIVVYPYGVQVSPREWNPGRRFWGFQTGRVYSCRPQALVEAFCRRNDIPVINMCEDFREAARNVYPLYYEGDGHWRPAGHRLAASLLYRALAPRLKTRESADGASAVGKATTSSTP
jgi:hypothetical protein